MHTTPRTSRLWTGLTGGAIAVAGLAVTTMVLSSAVAPPDQRVQELPLTPLPETEASSPTLAPSANVAPFLDRLLQHEHRADEPEDSFVPLPPGQTVAPEAAAAPELYVEAFTIEENALLNSEEPTQVEVDAFTGNIVSVDRRDND